MPRSVENSRKTGEQQLGRKREELREFARRNYFFQKNFPADGRRFQRKSEQQFYRPPDKFDMTDTCFRTRDPLRISTPYQIPSTTIAKTFAGKLERSAAVQCSDSSKRLNDVQSRGANGGQETAGQSHQQ